MVEIFNTGTLLKQGIFGVSIRLIVQFIPSAV